MIDEMMMVMMMMMMMMMMYSRTGMLAVVRLPTEIELRWR